MRTSADHTTFKQSKKVSSLGIMGSYCDVNCTLSRKGKLKFSDGTNKPELLAVPNVRRTVLAGIRQLVVLRTFSDMPLCNSLLW